MKYPILGGIRSVFAVALIFVMAFCVAACDFTRGRDPQGDGDPSLTDPPQNELFRPDPKTDRLHAEGSSVVTDEGEEVFLRGVNAGGLFVIEQWMNGFTESGPSAESSVVARDHKTTSQVFIDRFGIENAQTLWKTYQENWWSEADFRNCAAMGMNCIRLPFTYMTVDFDAVLSYDNAGDYDFSALDAFVETAAEYGMYTILDLHGAYGSQNGQDHSGETKDNVKQVDFYSNYRMIGLTADLWGALAEHYKDEPAVAGYDLLNEPGEKGGSTNETHFEVFDTLYRAVRKRDSDHIVVFESCWEGENLPDPSQYGWENCMYSFHHYTSMAQGGQFVQHGRSWNEKIANVSRQNFGVPLQMGEFNNYNDPEQWEYCLGLLNRSKWHWVSWTYKINNNWNNSAWGIYAIDASDRVNAHRDSYETILKKFAALKTTDGIYKTNLNGTLLEEIMKQYCEEPVRETIGESVAVLYDSISNYPLYVDGADLLLSDDRNMGTQFAFIRYSDGDGTYFIQPMLGGGRWTVEEDAVVLGAGGDAARFYPVATEYGYAFISYTTCRYLRLDGGALRADGKDLDTAAIFYTE